MARGASVRAIIYFNPIYSTRKLIRRRTTRKQELDGGSGGELYPNDGERRQWTLGGLLLGRQVGISLSRTGVGARWRPVVKRPL